MALRELMKLAPRYKVSLGQVPEWGLQAPQELPNQAQELPADRAAKPSAGMGP